MNIEELNAKLIDAENDEDKSENSSQFLTFMMNEEEYGIDILKVQEIRGWGQTTGIPNSAKYVKGVVNLRGTVVPVIDLRIRFGLEKVEYTAVTVVIVLKLINDGKEKIMGIVVDAVSDVHTVKESEVNHNPDLGDNVNSNFITGLGQVGDKTLILLDLDNLVAE